MKKSQLFLVVTLALNLALGTAWWLRRDHRASFGPRVGNAQSTQTDPLLAALASENPAALAAAGAPPETVRYLALSVALEKLQTRLRAVRPAPATDPRYWRDSARLRNPYTREQRAELAAAQSEFADTLRSLLGEDVSINPIRDPRRAFLPAAKQEQLARIEKDYKEMMDDVTRDAGSVRLAGDTQKLNILRAEMERDLAAALSPAERQMLDLRESTTAARLRPLVGDVLASEDDFRAVYTVQKKFDDRFPDLGMPNYTMETGRDRRAAEPELVEQIRGALGEEKFEAVLRANDQDRRLLTSLDRRLSLPPGAVDRAMATREAIAAESQRLIADASLAPSDRAAQLKQLAIRGREELTATLGPEAATAYSARASWLRYLSDGNGFTTDRNVPQTRFGLNTISFPLYPLRSVPRAP